MKPNYIYNAFDSKAYATRVSQFATWTDSGFAQGYDVLVDLNDLDVGNDGQDDRIRVQQYGEIVKVFVNDNVVLSGHKNHINTLRIIGSNDNDYITLATPMEITVDGLGGNDTLRGPDQFTSWSVDGGDSGRIGNWGEFSSIENLKGGTQGDTFSINPGGYVSGQIDGGLGQDALHYLNRTTDVYVDLAAGEATGTGSVRFVENVKGGSGDDVLLGDSKPIFWGEWVATISLLVVAVTIPSSVGVDAMCYSEVWEGIHLMEAMATICS